MGKYKDGRLQSRPRAQKNLGSDVTGLRQTGLETDRDGLLYVPTSFSPKAPSPLIVMLHGAGGSAHQAIEPLRELADRTGTILLAPQSQDTTWDIIRGSFGPDLFFIDEALSDLFSLYPIDPEQIAIAGFSDGASYALSVGAINSDLFSHVIAFSPGFIAAEPSGHMPKVFVSHGTNDKTLPIDRCSRQLVPKLQAAGADVVYEEFEGGHTIPTEIGRLALIWFLGVEVIDETAGAKVRARESGLELT